MADFELPEQLAAHPFRITWPVQWADQDAFGHVNNVIYFRWFESARIAYFGRPELAAPMSNQGVGMILASIKGDFRTQLTYPDTLVISARVESFGRTSLRMTHLLYSMAQQAIAAEADSVIVMFDYSAQRPVPVPHDIRAKIDRLEGRTG
jgi:acyl-CoA thioester hydrolase